MIFRALIAILVLAGGYAAYQIFTIQSYYNNIQTPLSPFTTLNEGNKTELTIVEFLNYDCGPCKETHLVLLEYARKNPNVRLVVRPVPFANGNAEQAALYALAAGLQTQEKFWDMDRALADYKGTLDDQFFRATAALYDIDFERMQADSGSEKVHEMAKDNVGIVQMLGVQTTPSFTIEKTLYQPDKTLTTPELQSIVQSLKN